MLELVTRPAVAVRTSRRFNRFDPTFGSRRRLLARPTVPFRFAYSDFAAALEKEFSEFGRIQATRSGFLQIVLVEGSSKTLPRVLAGVSGSSVLSRQLLMSYHAQIEANKKDGHRSSVSPRQTEHGLSDPPARRS